MYVLLRSPDAINLEPDGQNFGLFNSGNNSENLSPDVSINQTFDVQRISDNYFSNFWQSVIAVYFWTNGRWDQLDQWNFLPVQLICFFASILLITVMQNMLIAFMTSVFDDASTSGTKTVLKFRADLICDYETLIRIILRREDENENPKFLYYVSKVEEVERWEKESEKYCKMHKTILVDRFDSLTDDERSDSSDDESEWKYGEVYESDRDIKVKERKIYSSSFEDVFSNKSFMSKNSIGFESDSAERIERRMKEIQDDMKKKMKEIQDDVKNQMKSVEDKLEELLEASKT